jgi:tRNA modification GTPase
VKNYPTDTIVAQATPSGRGGISIVRISGPCVKTIAAKLLGEVPKPRYAAYLPFLDTDKNIIDEGVAIFFAAPHSFTGEDVLELQGHGGPAVVDILIRQVLQLDARLARPGEFSERAFLNDKMDLVQAEAIADLIDASSEQAARSALRSLQGEFSRRLHALVEEIIYLRTYVEAAIDFTEEEIDFLGDGVIAAKLAAAINALENIQAEAIQGTLLRDGIIVVIAGAPNVGKSSLLNSLCGTDTAIVTPIAGTTRDVLREQINVDGMPVHIIDTAGLRASTDPVEQEGMRRAEREIAQADILLQLHAADIPADDTIDFAKLISPRTALVIVKNKIDLTGDAPSITNSANGTHIALSASTGSGVDLLKNHIKSCVGFQTGEGVFSARRRHLDALAQAKDFLLTGQQQLHQRHAGELLAEDLRQAQFLLSSITGEFTADDLLGRIFGSFCIGK